VLALKGAKSYSEVFELNQVSFTWENKSAKASDGLKNNFSGINNFIISIAFKNKNAVLWKLIALTAGKSKKICWQEAGNGTFLCIRDI
jgi:hypothetical protein